MQIELLGKRWRIERPRSITHDGVPQHGECDPPDKLNKAIRVVSYVKDREELETFLHEMLHGCDWSKDEDWIEEAAFDLSVALWRLRYRRDVS